MTKADLVAKLMNTMETIQDLKAKIAETAYIDQHSEDADKRDLEAFYTTAKFYARILKQNYHAEVKMSFATGYVQIGIDTNSKFETGIPDWAQDWQIKEARKYGNSRIHAYDSMTETYERSFDTYWDMRKEWPGAEIVAYEFCDDHWNIYC